MSSVYVICWIFLQTFQTYFCIQAKQCGPWSDSSEQSDLGPHFLQKWLLKSQADDKADDNCCDWQFKGDPKMNTYIWLPIYVFQKTAWWVETV